MLKIGVAAVLLAISAITCIQGQAPIVYKVGVEDATVLDYLLSTPSIQRFNFSGVFVVFNYTQLAINDSLLQPSATVSLASTLGPMRFDAILGRYNISMAVATHTLKILYFIDSTIDFTEFEYKPHMFKFEIDYAQLNASLFDVSSFLGRNRFFILTDSTSKSSYFESNLEGKPFVHKLITSNTTDQQIYDLITVERELLVGNSWVLLFSQENANIIERIFNQSAYTGLLKSTDIYFVPTLTDQQEFMQNVRQSDVQIYTFRLEGMQRVNQSQILHIFVNDCFTHLANALNTVANTAGSTLSITTAMQQISIRGNSGLVAYRNGRRYGMSLSVVSLRKTLPATEFFEKVGVWTQGATVPYTQDFSKQLGIANSLIRFAAVNDPPYIYRKLNGELTGLIIELIQLMQASLKFRYEIVLIEDPSYGVLLPNGSWTGIMKYLVENKADMSANFLTKTPQRQKYVDATPDLLQSGIRILAKRVVHELDFFHVFYPFSWFVWLSILFSMFVLSATLWVSDKISPNVKGKSIFTIMESFFLVFSSFLMSKVETEPRKPSARLFTLLLWFSTLFYMTTYVSNLVAFLVKPDDKLPFSTIAELQNASNFRYVLINGSSTINIVERRWPQLLSNAQANWPNEFLQPNITAAVNKVLNSQRYVFVGSAIAIKYESNKDCSLMLPGGVEDVQYETFLMSKSFRYKTEINNFLTKVQYNEFPKLEQKYFNLNRCPKSVINSSDKQPLGFNYFAGLFALVGVGAILGFLYIILHWIFKRLYEFISRNRGKRLKYGNVYESEVIKVIKDGIWIGIEGRRQFYFISNNSLSADPTKVKNAKMLGLHPGDKLQVQYFGKDEATQNRIFSRLFENNKWFQQQLNGPSDSESD